MKNALLQINLLKIFGQIVHFETYKFIFEQFDIFGRRLSLKSWSFRQISDSLQGKFTTNIGTQIMWVKGSKQPKDFEKHHYVCSMYCILVKWRCWSEQCGIN